MSNSFTMLTAIHMMFTILPPQLMDAQKAFNLIYYVTYVI